MEYRLIKILKHKNKTILISHNCPCFNTDIKLDQNMINKCDIWLNGLFIKKSNNPDIKAGTYLTENEYNKITNKWK